MKVGQLFAASMLSVTALAVVPAAEIVVAQYRTLVDKAEAIKAVEAFGAVLLFSQEVVAHRAPYITPLFQEAPASQAQLDAPAKTRQSSDAALAKARTAAAKLSAAQAVTASLVQAAAKLAEIRGAIDSAIVQPLSARDPATVKGFLPEVAQVTLMIEPILNRLQTDVANTDASLTTLLDTARTAQDLRVTAGARAATLSPAISARRPLAAAEKAATDRAQGRIESDRDRIDAGVDQAGNPARLVDALKDAKQAYFGRTTDIIEQEIAAGLTDANYSVNADQLAGVVVPPIQKFLSVRKATKTEAGERAAGERDHAWLLLALAGMVVTALLGLLVGVTMLLRGRVITPIVNLTQVIGEMADGRDDVVIPTGHRADEIGAEAGSKRTDK